jgi:cell division protein FtsI (penicillin-binding protein 3)
MALVMDVRTGAVLALANWPAGNPNDASDRVETSPASTTNAAVFSRKFTNRALMDQHEPGSIMKPFVLAAALQERVTTPDEPIDCMGGYWPALRIHDTHEYGVIPLTEVLAHSSNIGTAQIGLRLGANRLHRYITSFGFGRVSGLGVGGELPGALTSLTNNLNTPKPRIQEVANASFGQGVTASTIQLTAATAAIANGGKRMYPYLIDAIVENDVPTPRAPREDRQVISEEVARQVTDMMESVVTDGTGKNAAVTGYRVAGKTGTAQMTEVDPVTKKSRYGDNYFGSFIGFLPADRPEVAITVSVVAPRLGTKYGGDVAGPVFSEIGDFTMRYLGVQPDPPTVLVADPADPTKKIAVAAPVKPIPEPVVLEPIVVSARGGQWRMPDLANRTLRDSVKAIESTGATVDVRGYGRLISQVPSAGTPIGPGVKVQLQFQ